MRYGKAIPTEFRQDIDRAYSPIDEVQELQLVMVAQGSASKEVKAKARNMLVNAQLRSIHSMAYGYADYRCPVSDLMAEGVLGFDKALELFDPTRGVRFFTFAMYHVRNEMTLFLHENYNVPMPMNKAKNGEKSDVFSIHSPMKVDTDATVEDTLPDEEDPYGMADNAMDVEKILGKSGIKGRSREFLRCRFEDDMTMEDIGEVFDISKQAVSTDIKKTLKRIRTANAI